MEQQHNHRRSRQPAGVDSLFDQQYFRLCCATDRLFVGLMVVQWVAGVAAALFVSPKTWIGATSHVHLHVWAAIALGGAISGLPIFLGLKHPGRPLTRHVIATAQVLWSALLIHVTGGRIETHFHVFVSLAFLSFYRDWRLLIVPSLVVAADHMIRGFWWPQSVYGVYVESPLRWLEHTAWVVFEFVVLASCCRRSQTEMRELSERQAQLETLNQQVEQRIQERTRELVSSEKKLKASEARLQAMLNSTLDPMITIDAYGTVQNASHSVETVLGWKRQELMGQNVKVLMPEPFRSQHDEYLAQYRADGYSAILGQSREFSVLRRDGDVIQCAITMWKVEMPEPSSTLLMGVIRDVTERKRMMGRLEELAYNDVLTGLPNRAAILNSIQHAIDRDVDGCLALLFLDFDGFKLINDSLGHDLGDQMLKQIANRLRQGLRTGDRIQPARLGGDEFVVLLQDVDGAVDAIAVAERILNLTSQSFTLDGHTVYSTASIGIVTSEHRYATASEMLRDADLAMYEAKAAGKGRYSVFNARMRERARARLCIENELRDAVSKGELILVYQPIMSLETGRIEGVEALLRWNHPRRGLLAPGEFISVAEETGLIIPIENWGIEEACRQFRVWQRSLGARSPRCVHVNLSRRQLLLPNLVNFIADVLAKHEVAAECLHVEVNENGIMQDPNGATRKLHDLQALGAKIDMDDFGTGCSSLSCLHEFPIDVLKIDRAFVANASRGRNFAALLHAIVTLADHLSMQVVAEGIEDADQLSFLQALGCEFGQGYFFSQPLSPSEFEDFVASNAPLTAPGRPVDSAITLGFPSIDVISVSQPCEADI